MGNNRLNWDEYFMGIAFAVSQRSEDTSTKHGCILVSKETNIILGTGYNGLIAGLDPGTHSFYKEETDPDFDDFTVSYLDYTFNVDVETRPRKYDWMVHSEHNAVLNCTQPIKFVLGGVKAYITGIPCPKCMQTLIQSGIRDLYLAERRGFRNHSEQDKNDFIFLARKMGVLVTYIPLEKVEWLKQINFE